MESLSFGALAHPVRVGVLLVRLGGSILGGKWNCLPAWTQGNPTDRDPSVRTEGTNVGPALSFRQLSLERPIRDLARTKSYGLPLNLRSGKSTRWI